MSKNKQAIIFCIAVFLISLLALSSCTTTKAKQSTSSTIETNDVLDVDSLVKAKVDSTAFHYLQRIKKLNASLAFGENCNDDTLNAIIRRLNIAIKDSVKQLEKLQQIINDLSTMKKEPGKLTFHSDGSFEAIGVMNANTQWLESLLTVDSLKKVIEQEKQAKIKAQNELKAKESVTVKTKKTRPIFWLLILCYCFGWLFPPEKLWYHTKRLFNYISNIKKTTV